MENVREKLRFVREKIIGDGNDPEKLRERLARKDQELAQLRRKLVQRDAGTGAAGVKPENIVWIFGTGRSGSTWLGSMMGEIEGNSLWDEPLVGALFGEFYSNRAGHKRGAKFIMGPRHKDAWLGSIRHTVLSGAAARYPEMPGGGYLIVKEPHGALGAPLLVEALPESRVILLVRDPRDVMASALDAHREGSWISRHRNRRPRKPGEGADPDTFSESDTDPDGFLEKKAKGNVRDLTKAREAYEIHEGRKVLVRYEDLRADALGTMRRIHATLGMGVDEEEIARVVEKHAWENIPEGKRGEGQFYRKARPGGWREDLTPGQAEKVEGITAPLLDEFYPGWRDEGNGSP